MSERSDAKTRENDAMTAACPASEASQKHSW
jgi:hypothetical protein